MNINDNLKTNKKNLSTAKVQKCTRSRTFSRWFNEPSVDFNSVVPSHVNREIFEREKKCVKSLKMKCKQNSNKRLFGMALEQPSPFN